MTRDNIDIYLFGSAPTLLKCLLFYPFPLLFSFLGSLGISVKGSYMVVMQKACNLPGRDKCAGKDGPHWLCHSIVV